MAVTIENQSGVTFTFQEGDVETVESQVVSGIEQYGIPYSSYASAQVADFEGSRKQITVSGVITEASTTRTSSGTTKTIQEQKDWLEGLQGNQIPKTFTSNYENEEIMVTKFKSIDKAGNPNELPFTLTLFVGQL